MPDPPLDRRRLDAVIFDLDGTLYRQGPLRRAMALRLLRSHLIRPVSGVRTIRAIAAYRRAQEELRGAPSRRDLGGAQLALAAGRAGVDLDAMAEIVAYWIEQAPLEIVARYIRPGLVDMLASLRLRGRRLAVLSDYPAESKLEALGIRDLFDLVLCAQEPEIGAFKPDPRGLEVALERLGIAADQALYVGDRAEVDAAAARSAGIPCAILSRRGRLASGDGFVQVACVDDLQSWLQPA